MIYLIQDKKSKDELSDDDWIYIGDWMEKNITKEKVSPELYKKFWPLGLGEVIGMICEGIHFRRGTGRYDEVEAEYMTFMKRKD